MEARGFSFGASRHPRAENVVIDRNELSELVESLLDDVVSPGLGRQYFRHLPAPQHPSSSDVALVRSG